jgi:hypothetical protein
LLQAAATVTRATPASLNVARIIAFRETTTCQSNARA